MKQEYIVIKTHNFDPETEATKFDDYRKATAYLHWMWEKYYNEEISCESHLDDGNCYHESDYARVQWDDGCYTEFILTELVSEREDFPVDWERYVME